MATQQLTRCHCHPPHHISSPPLSSLCAGEKLIWAKKVKTYKYVMDVDAEDACNNTQLAEWTATTGFDVADYDAAVNTIPPDQYWNLFRNDTGKGRVGCDALVKEQWVGGRMGGGVLGAGCGQAVRACARLGAGLAAELAAKLALPSAALVDYLGTTPLKNLSRYFGDLVSAGWGQGAPPRPAQSSIISQLGGPRGAPLAYRIDSSLTTGWGPCGPPSPVESTLSLTAGWGQGVPPVRPPPSWGVPTVRGAPCLAVLPDQRLEGR